MTCETSPGFQIEHRGMCRRQTGAAHVGQIHRRRFDLHSGGVERLFLQLREILSGRGPGPQALGQFGHRLLAFVGLGFLLGLLWPSCASSLSFSSFSSSSLASASACLVRGTNSRSTLNCSKAVGVFLVILLDLLGRNLRRFLLNLALQFLGQDLHLGELSRSLQTAESCPGPFSWPRSTSRSSCGSRPASCFFICGVTLGARCAGQLLKLGLGNHRLAIGCRSLRCGLGRRSLASPPFLWLPPAWAAPNIRRLP